MKIYIIEDDITVIGILEDIVEDEGLGSICGDTSEAGPNMDNIIAADPDLILVDLLMPGKDGIQVVRELREAGCRAKFIMLSQVSSKEMIAKAYSAGIEFFVQKPINLIEIRQVITNVTKQIENEQALETIQKIFTKREIPSEVNPPFERERKRLKSILNQLGMAGEKGAMDIVDMCIFLLEEGETVSRMGSSALCSRLSDNPKTMEQRVRRAIEKGLSHIASLGLEDNDNEHFTRYSSRLFLFSEVRAEMAYLQGKGSRGKVSLKTFLDGLLVLLEEE